MTPTPVPPTEAVPVGDEESLARLRGVKHIVVLMMENRSFDQMLGFLQGEGLEVEGIVSAAEKEREKPNRYPSGEVCELFEWGEGETYFTPPSGHKAKILDPCHSPRCVHEQLRDRNSGFVENFATTRVDEHGNPIELEDEYLRVPMGHYGAQHLPVYRHLAHNFCVCDHWHSSIPGDTWPNRLYSIAGKQGSSIGHKPGLLGDLLKEISGLPVVGGLEGAPIFDVPAFTHQLHDSQWRWYSHDPATLRAVDSFYRDFRHINRDNFAYFNRKKLSLKTQALEAAIVGHDSFLDDAAKGQLRDVSWIDPNFIDLSILDPNSNDDHPPSDVKAGQALVLEIYEALVNSPSWEDTVLVVVYDEHGGFYDHVDPPPPSVADDSGYGKLGVRVPALVVGPRVRNAVSHEVFEHTSLIATILRRFAADPERALQAMPERVRRARDLGALLEEAPRQNLPEHHRLREEMNNWRARARAARRGTNSPSEAPDGAGHPLELHDFAHEFAQFALAMRDAGLPPGQP